MNTLLTLVVMLAVGIDHPGQLISAQEGGDPSSTSSDSGAIGPPSHQVAPESPAHAPTSHEAIEFALSMYRNIRPEHTFVDIGCGDGRVLIAAVRKWNCRGVGYEIDPEQAALARACVEASGLSGKITIVERDATELLNIGGDAGYAYLYPETLEKLAPIIERFPAFVSYQHQVNGVDLKETQHATGNFYSKDPVAQAQTVEISPHRVPVGQVTLNSPVRGGDSSIKVVPARPYAVWGNTVHYQDYRPGCQCQMCRSIRAQLATPRTATVVVPGGATRTETSSTVTTAPARRGHFQRVCTNGVCRNVWVWDE